MGCLTQGRRFEFSATVLACPIVADIDRVTSCPSNFGPMFRAGNISHIDVLTSVGMREPVSLRSTV